MIGGTIIAVERKRPGIRLWVIDPKGTDDEAAVHVKEAPELPRLGDRIWWQGPKVFWTSADGKHKDTILEKLGNSYDPRPRVRRSRTSK